LATAFTAGIFINWSKLEMQMNLKRVCRTA